MAREKVTTSKFFKNNKLRLLIKIFLGFITAILLILLLLQYFQQDEWHSFGLIQSYGMQYVTLNKPIWEIFFVDRVGARTIIFILFNFFGTNSFYYSIFAVSIHILNSYLVYFLSKKITQSKLVSVVALLFFFFNSLGHQAYSWLGTMSGSSTSVTFILFSIIFYFNYLGKRTVKNLLLTLIFIWLSFLFKESGYFVFLLIPISWFLYEKNKSIKFFLSKNWPLLLYGLFVTFLFVKILIFIPGDRANYVPADQSGALILLMRLITYPIEGIGQAFVPFQIVFTVARYLTQIFIPSLQVDTSNFDIFYTTTMIEGLSVILSLFFIILFVFIFRKYLKKDKILSKFFIFSLAYLVLSFLPYVVLDKGDAYLDSRYYYMGLVGSSFLFSILTFVALTKFKQSKVRIASLLLLSLIFLSHVFYLESDLFFLALVSHERRVIITQIEKVKPKLDKKTVFYIDGNSPGYYGIPELKVPFQSGIGQVLLVVYGVKGQVDRDLFKEKTLSKTGDAGFLYDTVAQGYKEQNGRGFGYFYDKNMVTSYINSGKFSDKDVIWLFYDADSKRIIRETSIK